MKRSFFEVALRLNVCFIFEQDLSQQRFLTRLLKQQIFGAP